MFAGKQGSPSQRTGDYFEKLALRFLRKQGLKIRSKNYHCRFGEIDLILTDRQALVFVEVRYRQNEEFGQAHETVDWRKQDRLIKSAQCYLMQHGLYDKCATRFDIISISKSQQQVEIRWFKNAFLPHA